jgi:hypothetical protein
MNPHLVLDQLEHILLYVRRGDNAAAAIRLERLQDEVKQEAKSLDSWASKEETRNYVG